MRSTALKKGADMTLKTKRLKCFMLAVLTACAFIAGCSVNGSDPETEGTSGGNVIGGKYPFTFPLSGKTDTLNIIATGYNGNDMENVLVWREYEKMTGINVNWTTLTKEERAQEVFNALSEHRKTDLILRCKLSVSRLNKYGRNGYILDLAKDGMLEKYAPNCWAYLQAHPDTLASVRNPDGTIYSIPQVNSGAELRVAVKLFVNRKWLERVNAELPTTTEELRALLELFEAGDANGNGDTDDEIPFCSADLANTLYALYGAFGLSNRGFHNTDIDADPETGEARYFKGSESYKNFLVYMNGLYRDGLIDKYMFTVTAEQWLSNIVNDRVGMFAQTNLALVPAETADNWVAVDCALEGPDGDKLWSAIRANFHSVGAAVIPAECGDPALALKWLDYFWTDEGTLFYHMGVEGETYEKLEDGTYDYIPAIYEEMKEKGISFDDVISEYSPYPGGNNPTVKVAPYFMGGEMADVPANAARSLFEYGPTEYWPSFTFTDEENDIIDAISTDLSNYTSEMMINFITGATPFDGWDGYVDKLDKLGAGKLADVYQSAVNRYHELTKAVE